jgi:Zn-dependent alcohol dehydrogenase
VKIFYSGICGKQIEEFTAKMGKDKYLPHLLGHEGSGEILSVGPNVKHIQRGDRVVIHWMKSKIGQQAELPKYYWKNKNLNAGSVTTFSEMSVVSSNRLTKIPKNSDLKLAALLGCGLSTGLGAAINDAKINSDDNVIVIGSGGLGLSIILGAKFLNAKLIVALDKNNKNISVAKKIKANGYYLSNLQILKKKKLLGFFNKIFITACTKKNIKLGIKLASSKSNIFLIGVPSPSINFKVNALEIHRGKTFLTSTGGGILPEKDIPKFLQMGKMKKFDYKNLIIDIVTPASVNYLIRKMINGKNCHGRNLIKFY